MSLPRVPSNVQLAIEDCALIRNAVDFTTRQRASQAQLILDMLARPGAGTNTELLFIRSLEVFVTATEDVLSWILALADWEPQHPKGQLLYLLERININTKSEAHAAKLVGNLNPESLKALLRLADPKACGFDDNALKTGLQATIVGIQNIVLMRTKNERAIVRAYNKTKHGFLAIRPPADGSHRLLFPTSVKPYAKGLSMTSIWLTAGKENVQWYAEQARNTQAILHDTLAMILKCYCKAEYEPPPWVLHTYNSGGWSSGPEQSEH